jgi:hypothetical protein
MQAAEYFLRVAADDAKVLRDFFHDAETVYFDLEREVIDLYSHWPTPAHFFAS